MNGPTLDEVRREMEALKGSEMDRLKAALGKLWNVRAEAQRAHLVEAIEPERDGET